MAYADLSMLRFLDLDPANASLTGFASNVSGATWTLTATSSGDGLAHQVSIRNDTGNDKSAIDITIVGTDQNGQAQEETITGPTGGATVESTLYYLTLTSVTPASTWGADTADIGWVDEFITPSLSINWGAEDVAAIAVDVTGTINFTLQQTFDDLAGSPAVAARWQAIEDASSQTADGIWNTTGGATGVRLIVNSYTDTAEIQVNINPTRTANAAGAGGGGGGSDVDLVAVGGTAVVTGGVSGLLAIGGPTASDSPVASNPLLNGGRASSSIPTAVTSGDAVAAWLSLNGATVVASPSFTGADAYSNTLGGITDLTGGSRLLGVAGHGFNGTTWDRVRNAGSNLGLLVENGPYLRGRVTADGQIKASAGLIHTVSIAPLTATPTAGLLTIYDSTTETGTIVYAEWVFATDVGHTIILDIPCSTGIYVGFDAALADVQVTLVYR